MMSFGTARLLAWGGPRAQNFDLLKGGGKRFLAGGQANLRRFMGFFNGACGCGNLARFGRFVGVREGNEIS